MQFLRRVALRVLLAPETLFVIGLLAIPTFLDTSGFNLEMLAPAASYVLGSEEGRSAESLRRIVDDTIRPGAPMAIGTLAIVSTLVLLLTVQQRIRRRKGLE